MKIVFLNPSGELGGAEMALLDILAALREARPEWAMAVVASAPGPLMARTSQLGIPALPFTFPPSLARLGEWGSRRSILGPAKLAAAMSAAALPAIRYASRLRQYLAEFAPDIVHTNGVKMHLLGARTCPARARLLWHMHDYPDARPFTATLLSWHRTRCAAVLANSSSVATHTRSVLGREVPVHVLHNAVDLERFQPEGPRMDLDALSRLAPLPAGGVRIGLIGTFARWKGHAVFLEALASFRGNPAVRGYVIGDAIYATDASQFSQHELRRMAAGLGLGDSVGFTGRVEDVPAALRALDIVVHASVEREPFGLVIAEAMACGRPIVVSRAGGAVEVAEAGAVFHTAGSAKELADRLTQLVNDAGLRARLGSAGRTAAVRLFSRKRLANTLIPIYETIAPA